MERLTIYDGNPPDRDAPILVTCRGCHPGDDNEACGTCEYELQAIGRLADYEDAIPFDRVNEAAELLRGKDAGRMVVLPCRMGDAVYAINQNEVNAFDVTHIQSGGDGNICVAAECPERGDACRWCGDGNCCALRFSAENMVRRNIFLTREEAEAELKEEADHE